MNAGCLRFEHLFLRPLRNRRFRCDLFLPTSTFARSELSGGQGVDSSRLGKGLRKWEIKSGAEKLFCSAHSRLNRTCLASIASQSRRDHAAVVSTSSLEVVAGKVLKFDRSFSLLFFPLTSLSQLAL